MSIGLKQNRVLPGELCLKYCAYWGTWNRVLHMDLGGSQMVEFSLTPINPTKRDSWVDQVQPIRIRCHRTAMHPTDRLYRSVVKNKHSIVFQEVRKAMLKELPVELVNRMLNEDILGQIDWFKYLEAKVTSNGGGIPLDKCHKDD